MRRATPAVLLKGTNEIDDVEYYVYDATGQSIRIVLKRLHNKIYRKDISRRGGDKKVWNRGLK